MQVGEYQDNVVTMLKLPSLNISFYLTIISMNVSGSWVDESPGAESSLSSGGSWRGSWVRGCQHPPSPTQEKCWQSTQSSGTIMNIFQP